MPVEGLMGTPGSGDMLLMIPWIDALRPEYSNLWTDKIRRAITLLVDCDADEDSEDAEVQQTLGVASESPKPRASKFGSVKLRLRRSRNAQLFVNGFACVAQQFVKPNRATSLHLQRH